MRTTQKELMQAKAAVFVALLMLIPPTAAQEPHDAVCATTNAQSALGMDARFFCEAMESTAFVHFEQFVEGMQYLEETYPDYIEVIEIGQSVAGRPIYFVEVTNELSPVAREDKIQLGYSASIHANEPAGREGMVRVIEDLVAGIGPYGEELRPLLDHEIINVWFANPDSWATGDIFDVDDIAHKHECSRSDLLIGGPTQPYCQGFNRHNYYGVDLNREFPSPGLIHKDHTPMSEPESKAIVKELRFSGNHSNLVAGTDLHGMINSPNMIRSIIPNNDYDFRRMVLAVDMLRTTEVRVDDNPSFAEWNQLDSIEDLVEDTSGQGFGTTSDVAFEKPFQWGSRWDMIGYTDTGFTSDYMMLSPRSPTGGMGAVGTITEFAYSHSVPDNKYVAKLTDMHVAGVREIVRTQMEMVGRLDTPVLSGTGDVAYLDDGLRVTSRDDPAAYQVGQAFDINDESTWFDFDQVDYDVTNLQFWADLDVHSEANVFPVDAATFATSDLAGTQHLVITNQTLDALSDAQVQDILAWVESGGHLLLTDSALQWFDRAGLTTGAASTFETYLGHSDVEDWSHPFLNDVTWDARVTGEGPAIGMEVGNNYPQWVLDSEAVEALGGDVVGTTVIPPPRTNNPLDRPVPQREASLGRVPVGEGTVDFIGGALPMPRQVTGDNSDHRYGLADYSVSAFTYWVVMNSLGGHIEWQPIDSPFIPTYDFDPLYGGTTSQNLGMDGEEVDTPTGSVALVGVALAAIVAVLRRRV